jgi:hypothetical protein
MVKSPLPLLVVAVLVTGCRRQPAADAKATAVVAVRQDATVLPPDYDPVALVDKGAEPLQVYLAEPRNPTWAAVVEEAIGGQLRRDLKQIVPEARNLSMGCRTLSCLIIIDVPKEKLDLARAVVTMVTLGPITTDLGISSEGRGQILVVTERRMADPAEFTAWFRRTRRATLDGIRSGKTENPLPVPPSALPTE